MLLSHCTDRKPAPHGEEEAEPDSGHAACTQAPPCTALTVLTGHPSRAQNVSLYTRETGKVPRSEATRGEIQIQGCEIPDAGVWAPT